MRLLCRWIRERQPKDTTITIITITTINTITITDTFTITIITVTITITQGARRPVLLHEHQHELRLRRAPPPRRHSGISRMRLSPFYHRFRDSSRFFEGLGTHQARCPLSRRRGNNTGLSMLAAFGDFAGGELNYWPQE